MLRAALVIPFITALAIACGSGARGADGPGKGLDSAAVESSIKLGVGYLWSLQNADGGWNERPQYNCGVSSLVTLALLNCGEDSDSPRMRKALNYLRKMPPQTTYSVSLQAMVFCAAATKSNEDLSLIERNCRWLAEKQLADGSWSYPSGGGDPSNSQFALLALHEGQRIGIRLQDDPQADEEAWKKCFTTAEGYWHKLQNGDGSFPYTGEGSGSMTCAGIASLVIASSELSSIEAQPAGDTVACCGQADGREDRIRAAIKWLTDNFSITTNPNATGYLFYYLYALERAGRMTGNRFFGTHDWYREGADLFLRLQDKAIGLIDSPSVFESNNREENTAFALLFLSKGKRQIVVSRLEHGRGEDWNRHRRALQHLTLHTESVWKRDLSWQTVDIANASLADLLETPVLFISGTEAITLSKAQQTKLREYVEQGGFIFAEACNGDGCDGEAFEFAFRHFVSDTFEQPLEKLSPEHPIWSVEARVNPEHLPHDFWLYGVQSCCRLGLVYSPISLSCRWELNAPFGVKAARSAKLQTELDEAMRLGVNVLSYATGKQLKEKLDAVSILEGSLPTPPTDRGTLIIPQLEHAAGSEDAPRALPNLLLWLSRENPFQLSNQHRVISITPGELEKYPIVFMHGRGGFRFSEKQRQALREYFDNGGFLFADAICANEEFAISFRREMDLILPQHPLERLPSDHPLLTTAFKGYDVRQVSMLDPTPAGDKLLSGQRRAVPQLEIARVEDRIAVVFSPLDMSCALESRHSLQCRGYLREDAARIGINIILFALQQ
jgi:hypothetical protein